MFTIKFDIDPVAKGRPKASTRGGFVRMYTPAKTAGFEKILKAMAKNAWKAAPLQGALAVQVTFLMARPKSAKKREYVTVRPDLDNYIKALLDALNEVVWLDDAQIVDLHASKEYDDNPCIILGVSPLEIQPGTKLNS